MLNIRNRKFRSIIGQRPLQVALALWIVLTIAGVAFHHASEAMYACFALGILLLEMGVVALLTRRRHMPDLAQRAPERAVALAETWGLWVYGALVMAAGRIIGLHFFGEGIALHLNGSLVGATRGQRPVEVYTWAAYNGFFLALVPYVVFRMRGYSRQAMNLKSANLKNDTLVIAAVLAISIALDLTGPNIFWLTPHQQLVGGLLSFVLHLFGTDLPVMIFIYAILMPRYFRLTSPATAFLLAAASYPTLHIFESWTHYDSPSHSVASIILIFLVFFPPGLMKSFLTLRTGNAWVHLWAFHAISPHVTIDTRLIVKDFNIR
jgi:hypothetical protein